MIPLSTTSLATIGAAARRAARLLNGVAAPVTLGVDVTLTSRGAVSGVTVGEGGPPYELDRLDAATFAEAMIDAAGAVRSGPRAWRRV